MNDETGNRDYPIRMQPQMSMNSGNIEQLVRSLCKLPAETSWVEFKRGYYEGDMIGQRICGLANAAALEDRRFAYLVWGVEDGSHEIVGTEGNFPTTNVEGQEMEGWIRQRLSRNADFTYATGRIDGRKVEVLTISPAIGYPVAFRRVEYIRIGSVTRKMEEFKELSARLWGKLRDGSFESRIAKTDLTPAEAIELLDVQSYFLLKRLPLPSDRDGIIHYLQDDGLVTRLDDGNWGVTNLGAILFARRLSDFGATGRKSLRIVRYADRSRMAIEKNELVAGGYASQFESAMRITEALAPGSEPVVGGLRRRDTAYPSLAVREALANALVHQDFTEIGTGPTLELFPDRMEIANPGKPLVDVDRIIDSTPKSRNEHLASLMRQFGFCEELGTGWDKIVIACEINNLPPPKIQVYENGTRVTLFAARPFSGWTMEEKCRSCYYHSCIRYVQGDFLTNQSLRERLGLPPTSAGSVSRLISGCVERHLVKPVDPEAGNRYMKYVPYWA